MKKVVFFSWQSDIANSINRNFIERAIAQALKSLNKEETTTIEIALDRDTAGLPGTPAIAESILAKISQADVYVADVTIINSGSQKRLTPNPNVLLELGFAVSKLGWDKILLVQNAAFGKPELLPFDLRGRRIIQYDLAEDEKNKDTEKGLLQGRIESGLRAALNLSENSFFQAGKNVPIWWGQWEAESHANTYGGNVFVYEVGSSGFSFKMDVYDGSHMGQIAGYAHFVTSDLAHARIEATDMGVCELSFRRSIESGRRIMSVEETGPCHYFRGAGVGFTGNYIRKVDFLFETGFLNEIDLSKLYSLTGKYFDSLTVRFQLLGQMDCADEFPARVMTGGVRGLFTIMEGIVMRGEMGALWVAYIDDTVVRYFTTELEFKEKLPKTFELWREKFKQLPVLAHMTISSIPSNTLEGSGSSDDDKYVVKISNESDEKSPSSPL